jgi:hypothetical protein
MKKVSIILAAVVLVSGITLANPFQANQDKAKTEKKDVKKDAKKTDKKVVKKVPARKNVTKKEADKK